jgi:thymidylate synthase ThyX
VRRTTDGLHNNKEKTQSATPRAAFQPSARWKKKTTTNNNKAHTREEVVFLSVVTHEQHVSTLAIREAPHPATTDMCRTRTARSPRVSSTFVARGADKEMDGKAGGGAQIFDGDGCSRDPVV